MREPGFSRKLKFSDKFCQIFPGRTTLPIFLEIQRSLFANGSFSDGNWQHVHRISERTIGRPAKNAQPSKKISIRDFVGKLVRTFGLK